MIFRRLTLVIVGLALMGTASVPERSFAQQSDADAGAFVSRLGNSTIAYLSDPATPQRLREDQLRGLLREGFDVERIGRFVLGKYRRTSSQAEINEFIGVFEEYIVVLYAKQFSAFSDVNFAVEKVVKTKRRKDSMVSTKIVPENGTWTSSSSVCGGAP